jgi:hypothetical protein
VPETGPENLRAPQWDRSARESEKQLLELEWAEPKWAEPKWAEPKWAEPKWAAFLWELLLG